MISPFRPEQNNNPENFTFIDSSLGSFTLAGPVERSIANVRSLTLNQLLDIGVTTDLQYCYDVMKLKEIQVSS